MTTVFTNKHYSVYIAVTDNQNVFYQLKMFNKDN